MTPWAEIRRGDVVEGGDGQPWEVTAIEYENAWVALLNPATGQQWSGTPSSATVRRIALAVETVQAAADTVTRTLGAVALSPGGWPLPRVESEHYAHPGTVRAHLWIFHDQSDVDIEDSGLVAFHAGLSHDVAQGGKFVAHTHS